ncbi:LytR/AlgR family response regulator transcription factor [Aquiflexum gelatinilyticum]|uniref:LytR/AlgR family response regulator transcription factor n=1 Tax=Aquiflexum gelatinilyticum TaxID=2961943 RepID=UPI00216A2FD1|nr:LytTR family DNA-binding domain-containing protein [Aquiflexum gelatinilyticum]MCS4433727.1 LytTR family DNA-binding domain-containing protein [Aquiflexum gelatinilyticum]
MKILIIEDERPAANRLRQLVLDLLPNAEIFGHLDSITSAVKWLETNVFPDLIFCDIQLADGQSFEIFERVKVSSPIIFTTAFDQFAIKAFKLNSVDYLLKPIDPKELAQAIQKFQSQQVRPGIELQQIRELLSPNSNHYKSRFLVKFGEKIQSVLTEDISIFYSEEKVTFLQTVEGRKYILDYTLDQLESMLDPRKFFRLNRKYIASFSAIAEIHTYSNSRLKIKLANCCDNDILISREKVGDFKDWLNG